jgi:hypothetical protein
MKKLALPLLAGALVLSGCASSYVIKLTNGTEITTPSKPRREGGAYVFKDAKGEEHAVAVTRVREIAPASIAAEEKKPKSGPSLPTQHKRKWYFLWLA